MLNEFKQFLFRGNAIDLAVGVVVGASFGAVVSSLVSDILTPFISAIAKVPDFSDLSFTLNESQFMYGHFLNVLISFILVSFTVFFFVIKPINILFNKMEKETPKLSATKKCPECLSDIPIEAKRCSHCSQLLE